MLLGIALLLLIGGGGGGGDGGDDGDGGGGCAHDASLSSGCLAVEMGLGERLSHYLNIALPPPLRFPFGFKEGSVSNHGRPVKRRDRGLIQDPEKGVGKGWGVGGNGPR